jgi:hypothetical protein
VLYFGGTAADWDAIRAERFEKWGRPHVVSFEGERLMS